MQSAYLRSALLGSMVSVLALACSDDAVTVVDAADVIVTAQVEELDLGETTRLTAEVRNAAGRIVAGAPVTWISMSPITATISSDGVVTAGESVSGPVTFLARAGEAEGSIQLVVLPPPIASITFEIPWELGSRVVTWVDTPVRLVAVPRDRFGVGQPGRLIEWWIDEADVDLLSVTTNGTVRGVSFPGRGRVWAAVDEEGRDRVEDWIYVTVGSEREECLIMYDSIVSIPDTRTGDTRHHDIRCRLTDPGQFATPPANPWLVRVPSAGRVNFRLDSTAFDAVLILTDINYRFIAWDDDGGGGEANRNAWIQETLPAGDYIIWVTSYSARTRPVKSSYGGAGTGTYTLSVTR